MNALRQYFRNIADGVTTIISGMSVSIRHLNRDEVTLEYPDVRDELPPRSRMSLFMNADECIACNQCARACPVNCIHIESEKRTKHEQVPVTVVEQKKKMLRLTKYEIDLSQCCYCALCVEPCPTHCLYMTPEFEFSVVNEWPEQLTVRSADEDWQSADGRRMRTRCQTQHPKFGRQGLVYDFMAITDDLHRRGEHVPMNPLYPDEYAKILAGPVLRPEDSPHRVKEKKVDGAGAEKADGS